MKRLIPLLSLFLVLAGMVAAQRSFGGRSRGGWGGAYVGGVRSICDVNEMTHQNQLTRRPENGLRSRLTSR